ncbi:MAG: sulfotransferase [Cyanobacteria bacterium J06621_11]
MTTALQTEKSTTAPIILVGTHRSGTSWLTRVFQQHPDLACWMEPRYVWSWGNNYKPNDVLTQQDAQPHIAHHIRQRFERFVQSQGKHRLFEKTPSNCLRIRFIHAVFPNAKIIHLLRDGRSVFNSASDMLESGFYRPDKLTSRFYEMLKETPMYEWPAHWPRIRDTLSSKLTKKPLPYWGPRPEGWQDWLSESSDVVLAKQWAATAMQAASDGENLPSSQYARFRYEDLIVQPHKTLTAMIEFAELSESLQLMDYATSTVFPNAKQRQWKNLLDEKTMATIRPHLQPALTALGYEW